MKRIQLSNSTPQQTPAGASGMAYTTGDMIDIFKREDGWYYFFHGVASGGNAYEGDDIGPFASAEEAEADARAAYQA